MAKCYHNVLDALGHTPMVKLARIVPPDAASVLVKLENLNLGGSIKSRTAYGMITAAERAGKLRPDSIIVEPTSGNQGIGLAMVGAIKGYKVRIVMPASMSEERRKLIQAYGAEIVLTPVGKDVTETFDICIRTAYQMAAEDPRIFIPQQFENPANPDIHRQTTAREIVEQVEGNIDAFIAGIGTGGTITGIGEVLKEHYPGIKIYAVEPSNAAVLSGGKVSSHQQQGIGDGFIPGVLNREIYDAIICVSDEDALATARLLAREEGLLVGISSGSNVWAALQVAGQLGSGKTVVTILPDTGERYYSTRLFA
ncbi:MAG: cysteine synthase [Clostridia bacterium]|nr:cysteine synthase [Clostridia bacterium]